MSYSQHLSTFEFLETSFILLKKKVMKIKEINSRQRRGKLSLPDLKLKLEMTSDILEALRILISNLDFDKKESSEIAELYNTIGNRLSLANMDLDDKMYQNVLDIIDAFLTPSV